MPSFWTHYAFAEECKNTLTGTLGDAVARHPAAYYAGMQGPDPLLLYLPAVLRKKRLSTLLHVAHTARLLACLWRQATKMQGEAHEIALAYAVGFWGHYCLDSETHPFIYAHAGLGHSAVCIAKHNALEADLNELTVGRVLGKSLSDLPFPEHCHPTERDTACISRMLSRAIGCIYQVRCSPRMVGHAFALLRIWSRLLSDRSGRKAKYARVIEKPLRRPYLSPLFLGVSRYYPDPANFAHQQWHDPYTGTVSTADFFALYDAAKRKFSAMTAAYESTEIDRCAALFDHLCERDFHGEPIR